MTTELSKTKSKTVHFTEQVTYARIVFPAPATIHREVNSSCVGGQLTNPEAPDGFDVRGWTLPAREVFVLLNPFSRFGSSFVQALLMYSPVIVNRFQPCQKIDCCSVRTWSVRVRVEVIVYISTSRYETSSSDGQIMSVAMHCRIV